MSLCGRANHRIGFRRFPSRRTARRLKSLGRRTLAFADIARVMHVTDSASGTQALLIGRVPNRKAQKFQAYDKWQLNFAADARKGVAKRQLVDEWGSTVADRP
jgi:hypothetical protein